MKLILTSPFEGWYCIERAEHDGKEWTEPTLYGSKYMCSHRLAPEADVEGDLEQMKEIARAIRFKTEAYFKRCAVKVLPNLNAVTLWSPNNSKEKTVVTLAEAIELAEQIETVSVSS